MSIQADQIIVALDHANFDECKSFVNSIGSNLRFVKIGSILYSACGPKVLEFFAQKNIRIFLDLKYHDIPNTVSNSIEAVLQHAPIDLLTIHASGGSEMISQAKQAVEESKTKTQLIAVTVLTSLDQKNLSEIGFASEPSTMVLKLANLAITSGADGVVCSPNEIGLIRKNISKKITIVVPGIRPAIDLSAVASAKADDQKRTATPEHAFEQGASYVVIGRPITQAKNPADVFQKMLQG